LSVQNYTDLVNNRKIQSNCQNHSVMESISQQINQTAYSQSNAFISILHHRLQANQRSLRLVQSSNMMFGEKKLVLPYPVPGSGENYQI